MYQWLYTRKKVEYLWIFFTNTSKKYINLYESEIQNDNLNNLAAYPHLKKVCLINKRQPRFFNECQKSIIYQWLPTLWRAGKNIKVWLGFSYASWIELLKRFDLYISFLFSYLSPFQKDSLVLHNTSDYTGMFSKILFLKKKTQEQSLEPLVPSVWPYYSQLSN